MTGDCSWGRFYKAGQATLIPSLQHKIIQFLFFFLILIISEYIRIGETGKVNETRIVQTSMWNAYLRNRYFCAIIFQIGNSFLFNTKTIISDSSVNLSIAFALHPFALSYLFLLSRFSFASGDIPVPEIRTLFGNAMIYIHGYFSTSDIFSSFHFWLLNPM